MRLVLGVYDDHRVRAAGKIADAAEALLEAGDLAVDEDALELRVRLGELAGIALLLEVSEAVDALLDLDEVGDRTAEPAAGDERLTDTLRDLAHLVRDFALAADEEDDLAVAGKSGHGSLRLRELLIGLGKVEDLDLGLRAEHEALHGRVAAAFHLGEMSARLEETVNANTLRFCSIHEGYDTIALISGQT